MDGTDPRNSSAALRRALGAVLLAAAAAGVLLARAPTVPCVDLCTYRAAGALARAGRPADAYDGAALAAAHRADHDLGRRVGGFLYSPLWLAPAMALAAEPLATAERLHRAAGAVALALALALVLYRLRTLRLRIGVATAVALSHVGWAQLVYQNWTVLLFLLLAVATLVGERGAASARRSPGGSRSISRLSSWSPCCRSPRPGAGGGSLLAAVAAAAFALLSLAWADPGSWRGFARQLTAVAERGVTPYYNKVSLPATVAHFLSEPRSWLAPRAPVDSPWVRWLPFAGLPLLAWGTARLRGDCARLSAFAIAWMLLFVPQIWDHTEILLVLLLPVLPARWAWTMSALLAATYFYNPMVQGLLRRTLAGEVPPLRAAHVPGLLPGARAARARGDSGRARPRSRGGRRCRSCLTSRSIGARSSAGWSASRSNGCASSRRSCCARSILPPRRSWVAGSRR